MSARVIPLESRGTRAVVSLRVLRNLAANPTGEDPAILRATAEVAYFNVELGGLPLEARAQAARDFEAVCTATGGVASALAPKLAPVIDLADVRAARAASGS